MKSFKNFRTNSYFKMGDVVYGDLGAQPGSVQGGERFLLIVSNNIGNAYSPVYTVLPFTARRKNGQPTHRLFEQGEGGLPRPSVLLGEQITTISKERVYCKVGEFNDAQMKRASEALICACPVGHLVVDSGVMNTESYMKIITAS